jgi:hypothetical protein
MNKLFDLRFVIGLFFLVIGILLVLYSLSSGAAGGGLNLKCGGVFIGFGIVMVVLSTV